MAWTYLIIAGLFEVAEIIGLKRGSEKDNWINNIILIGGFIISFNFLSQAMQEIPLSTAYAVWTVIGTLGSAIIGMGFYKEPQNVLRIICIVGLFLRL